MMDVVAKSILALWKECHRPHGLAIVGDSWSFLGPIPKWGPCPHLHMAMSLAKGR